MIGEATTLTGVAGFLLPINPLLSGGLALIGTVGGAMASFQTGCIVAGL